MRLDMHASQNRLPGISFVIRARNEDRILFDNLMALRGIQVPHEIIVVLHRCRDDSKEVAKTWQKQGLPIQIFEDETVVSRAGYETLVTPASHPNSFSAFSARCFSHAKYNWLVRWDADFVATDYFIEFVNTTLDIADTQPKSYALQCALGDDAVCHEEYMFNTYLGFTKYFCWEACQQAEPHEVIWMDKTCMQSVSPVPVKPYWREPPWFLCDDTRDEMLAEKYAILVSAVGPEPPGFARSNNPEFLAHWDKLAQQINDLAQYHIYPTR